MLPWFFHTQQDYDNYLRCKSRIKVGDKVCLCLYNGHFYSHETKIMTSISQPFDVIGLSYDRPVIGSRSRQYDMYPLTGKTIHESVRNVAEYNHMYVLMDNDCRVAKIIKQRR